MSEPIHAPLAPAAIGAYSHAIKSGQTLYVSGQIPLKPETMVLCGDHISDQIDQVFLNLAAVCAAGGASLDQIVKMTVYLLDLDHFQLVNDAMERHFTKPYPARAVIGVAALPRHAKIEIDAIVELGVSA